MQTLSRDTERDGPIDSSESDEHIVSLNVDIADSGGAGRDQTQRTRRSR